MNELLFLLSTVEDGTGAVVDDIGEDLQNIPEHQGWDKNVRVPCKETLNPLCYAGILLHSSTSK